MVVRRLVRVLLVVAVLIGGWTSFAQSVDAQAPPLRFVGVRSPVARGSQGSVTVQTRPGASCTILVTYKSPNRARDLYPQTANRRGLITWTWVVSVRTAPGNWPIVVQCGPGSRIRTTFRVL